MPRFWVKDKDDNWNIFSTIVDDFLFKDFLDFDDIKAFAIGETVEQRIKELDSLLTNKPRLNVMSLEEALERRRMESE